jgi:hypothetical protein
VQRSIDAFTEEDLIDPASPWNSFIAAIRGSA